jgi:hypothetical protein
MNNPNFLYRITGIKCDNPKCDFVDKSVTSDDYELWLNKPCPKCGENLLTEDDFMLAKAFQLTAEKLQNISEDELRRMNNEFLKNMTNDDVNNILDFINENDLKIEKKERDGNDVWSITKKDKNENS